MDNTAHGDSDGKLREKLDGEKKESESGQESGSCSATGNGCGSEGTQDRVLGGAAVGNGVGKQLGQAEQPLKQGAQDDGITICRADKGDVESILKLASDLVFPSLSSFRKNNLNFARRVRRDDLSTINSLILSDDAAIFVAKDRRGRVVGHIIARLDSRDYLTGDRQAWIFDLSVRPMFWGKGIARRLTEAVELTAMSKGIGYIGLTVTCSNTRAVHFYNRAGFQNERCQMVKKLEPLVTPQETSEAFIDKIWAEKVKIDGQPEVE